MSERMRRGGKPERGGDELAVDRFALADVIPSGRDFIFLDAERCTGCGNCVAICPMDLWRMRGGRAELAEGYRGVCVECGSCFIACEAGAVDFTYPPGGTGVAYRYA
ncbi:MAG: 4Fe-4S binding protein [Actinomycetota bacterium]|nr:4Fe-4S binding protein [Actinomycetota bacterium]